MKKLLMLALLASVSVGYTQNAKERASNLLADKIGEFTATAATESRIINDGATRVERTYQSGENTLEIEINIPKGKEAIEKASKELGEILLMFEELGNEGRIEFLKIDEPKATGALTFREGRGSGVILAYRRFMIELKLSGAESMDDIKSVYESLNVDTLQKPKD